MLPGGQSVLFTIVDHGHASIAALRLDEPGTVRQLVEDGSRARYLPTGHLIYRSKESLFAVGFDPKTLAVNGVSYPVVRDADNYDVSRTGTLVYVSPATGRLGWVDRRGVRTPIPVALGARASFVALSPTGDRALVSLAQEGASKLNVVSLGPDAALTPLTPGGADYFGEFTRDGTLVLFTSGGSDSRYNIYSTRADAGGPAVRQTNSPDWHKATSIAPSGDVFLYNDLGGGSADVWQQQMNHSDTARPVLKTPDDELEAVFSRDGSWIAYQSNASGRFEVYVKGYPDGPRTVVSTDGGQFPRWNPRGEELFYQMGDEVLAVRIVNGVRVGPAARLFELSNANVNNRCWDVAPDGERFLVAENSIPPRINVITNWFEELKAKVPVR